MQMMLEVEPLAIPDVKLIKLKKHEDGRGFFSETFNQQAFVAAGLDLTFVQDNHTLSRPAGTVRGLHYQIQPFAQGKLVRVVRGRILDVAVDLRRQSDTFGRWVAVELSIAAWNQIFVPVGFAHGFCTLEPNSEVIYKVTNFYSAKHEFGVRWNDPDLNIPWPTAEQHSHLSEKDRQQPFLKDVVELF